MNLIQSRLIIILFLDELQLSSELTEAANNAVALPSEKVNKEAMYFGILTNKILPGATVLGFSRDGNYVKKEFLHKKTMVYNLLDVDIEDFREKIQAHAKESEQMKSIFKKIKQIGLNQILFAVKILEHQEQDFGNITSATDLFLIILLENLGFHNRKNNAGFLQLLKDGDKDFLKNTFKLCKENLQTKEMNDRAGVFVGTLIDENWVSAASRISIPLKTLKSVGIFEISSSNYGTLLTAKHLSFVEFFASVGIILSSDLMAELEKINIRARIKAVSVNIWNDLLKIENLSILYSMKIDFNISGILEIKISTKYILSDLLQDPGSKDLLKSFQDLLFPHDEQKRINLQQKAFSVIAAGIKKLEWLLNDFSVSEVKTAALLAWEGYLTSVEYMNIVNIDITDIPRDQMKKLTAIVTGEVWIDNITPTSHLGSILAWVKCPVLWLRNMELTEENTRALVTAMRERVEEVRLGSITLNIDELNKYDGRGRCRELRVWGNTKDRHRYRLRRWAAALGWRVTRDTDVWLRMEKSTFGMIRDIFKT